MSNTIKLSESQFRDIVLQQVRKVLGEADAREVQNAIEGTKFTEDDISKIATKAGGIEDIAVTQGRADVLAVRGSDGNMFLYMTSTRYVTVHEAPSGMSAREFAEASQTEPGFYGEYPQIGSFEVV